MLVVVLRGGGNPPQSVKEHKIDGQSYNFNDSASASTGTVFLGTNSATINNYGTISQSDESLPVISDSLQANSFAPLKLASLSNDCINSTTLEEQKKYCKEESKIFKAMKITDGSSGTNYGHITATGNNFFSFISEPALTGMYASHYSHITNDKSGTIDFSTSLNRFLRPEKMLSSVLFGREEAFFDSISMLARDNSTAINNGNIVNNSQFGMGMVATNNSKAINNGTISHKQKDYYDFCVDTVDTGYSTILPTTHYTNYIQMYAYNHSTVQNNKNIDITGSSYSISNKLYFMLADNNSLIKNYGNINITGYGHTTPQYLTVEDGSNIENHGNITISNMHFKDLNSIIYGGTVINYGNINIKSSSSDQNVSDFRGLTAIESYETVTNYGTITIDANSHNVCGIKITSDSSIKKMGTIIIKSKTGDIKYTDLKTAENAPTDANGNKPICHEY